MREHNPNRLRTNARQTCHGNGVSSSQRSPDGSPDEGDLRYVLKRNLKEAADMEFTVHVGSELEFFLFE